MSDVAPESTQQRPLTYNCLQVQRARGSDVIISKAPLGPRSYIKMDRYHAKEFGLESGIVDMPYHQEDREDTNVVNRRRTQTGQTDQRRSNGNGSIPQTQSLITQLEGFSKSAREGSTP